MHAGLRAAGEHGVGVAALDQLGRLADRVRAGRAGRDDRVVRAADPERDRDLPARRVDEHAREEERRDAVGAAVAQDVGLLDDPDDAADRRAEDDPDAVRVEAVQPASASASCAAASANRTLRSIRRASFGGASPVGSKSFTSAAMRTGNPLASNAWMKSIPLSPGERRLPGRRRVVAERRDRAEPGDRDASHAARS